MKRIKSNRYYAVINVILALFIMVSCEQTHLDPELEAAPGGGTLTTYKAYALDSVAGMGNVYGRIVFWQGNASNTLVQLSLFNTTEGELYPSGIFGGELSEGSASELMSLYSIDGSKGEFSTHKYYVIDDAEFFTDLTSLDAHVSIFRSATDMIILSAGNVGLNATPVQQAN